MGFLSTLERRTSPESPSTSLDKPAAWLFDALGARSSHAGPRVNEFTAMQFSAVFACVRILAETLAYLPLPVYERLERGKKRAPSHPNYQLLHDRPNPELTSFNWRELMQAHLALWGNAWAEKEELKSGKVVALWPLMPNKTRAERRNGRKVIITQVEDGREVVLAADRVLHIPGLGFNGLNGFSVLRMQMQAVGLGLAAEEFGARFYSTGGAVKGVLQHDGKLSPTAQKNLRESFESTHGTLSNSQRLLILEEGLKYEKIGIPPEEAQFIQLRKFQVNEICRFYRIPPHMVQDIDRPFQSNVEQMGLDFVRYTMGPWLVRWEQILNWDLFSETEREKYYAEFNVEGLLRGDSTARAAFYQQLFGIGGISPNEIAELENFPIVEGGDERFVPMNFIPLSQAKAAADAIINPPEPEPDPAGDPDDEPEPERGTPPVEERVMRSLAFRQRIQLAHRRLFRDAANRIVTKEVKAAQTAARKAAGDDFVDSFRKWAESFYPAHREYVVAQVAPVVEAMGSAIWAAASDEIGVSADLSADGERFLREYVDAMANRHIGSSQGQLDALLNQYGTADEVRALVEERLGEWAERRPDKIADEHTNKLGSAVARERWLRAGRSLLRWASSPGSCQICQEMNGRTVSITETFLSAGQTVNPEGDSPMVVQRDFAHPPLHGGCTCGVVAA